MGMKKFWRLVDEVISECNIVLEVIDARVPELTRNKKVEGRIVNAGKPFIIVLNKSDLIGESMRKDLDEKFVKTNHIFVSTRTRMGFDKLREKIFDTSREKRNIKVGVVGYPNTGKSSVINGLAGRKKAKTSSLAGFTRGVQWVSDKHGLLMFDTPGVVPFEERDEAQEAIMSIISPAEVKDPDYVAAKIIEMFLEKNKRALEGTYKIKIESDNAEEIIFAIGKKMNYLIKGGDVNMQRTTVRIINDWQKGKLLLNI